MQVIWFDTDLLWASRSFIFPTLLLGLFHHPVWENNSSSSRSRMPSRESYEVHKEEKSLVQKAKREANQEDILAAALGMRMGPQKPPAAFWQPLKLFAYSQLTSLVRRATLRESDRSPRSEKVHNFKVRPNPLKELLSAVASPRNISFNFVMWGLRAAARASLEVDGTRGGGSVTGRKRDWKTELFGSVQWASIKRKSVGRSVDHCC